MNPYDDNRRRQYPDIGTVAFWYDANAGGWRGVSQDGRSTAKVYESRNDLDEALTRKMVEWNK